MSEDKKVVGDSKLSLSEEMHLGFLQSMSKTNTEKILGRFWRVYLKILVTVIVMMLKVGVKILRIGPGGQVIRFSENRPSNKITLRA